MDQILQQFDPITLEEMSGIRLMNRIDTKFVTTLPVLMQLLQMAQGEYRVQEIGQERNMRYDTTYFDTLDFNMFHVHQTGHTGRQKLRFRTYVSSNLQFMEVKTKNNHGRTKKRFTTISTASRLSTVPRPKGSPSTHRCISTISSPDSSATWGNWSSLNSSATVSATHPCSRCCANCACILMDSANTAWEVHSPTKSYR